MGPSAGVIRRAAVPIESVEIRRLRERQTSRRHDVEAAEYLVAVVCANAPERCRVVPCSRFNACREPDVATQIILVGDVAEIAKNLRLRGISLGPLPFRLEFAVEAVGIV